MFALGENNHRFRWIACGILLVAGVLLYGYTLSFPFVFDDHIYLVQNPFIKDAGSFAFVNSFSSFATKSREMGLDPDLSTNFILRPVTYLTFHLNYAADGLRPHGYRAVNIAIHCLNAILLFHVLLHLLRSSPKRGDLSPGSAGFIALGSAALFLVHPLQTESVTYIVQRFTSLGAFFYLLATLTHLLANAATSRRIAWSWRSGSVAAFVLGMLSKEEVFTAPFLLIAMDWLVMGTRLRTAVKRALPLLLCLPIIPIIIALTSHAQNAGNLTLTGAVNIVNPYNYPPLHYALTQLSVVLTYLRLILVPSGLNLDWDYPLSTSLLQGRVLISFALIVALLAGSWLWYWKRRTDVRVALIFVSVLWYFTALAISSSVVPLPDLMVEHRCYLASIGAVLGLVCVADLLRTRLAAVRGARFLVPALIGIWVLALSATTMARNHVWRSEIAIWNDTTVKSPRKGRPWSNLGVAYFEQGKQQESVSCLLKAVQVDPFMIHAYLNLGRLLNQMGRHQESLVVSQLGQQRAVPYEEFHFNMGVSYYNLGQTAHSIQSFTEAVRIRPSHLNSHLCLAELHAKLGHHDDAWKHCRIAASLSLGNPILQQTITRIESLTSPRGSVFTMNLPSHIEPVRVP